MIQAAAQRISPKAASITRTQTALSVALKALLCVFVFAQSVLATPFIERSPQSVTVPVGAPVTLTVSATGTGPLTYQWRKAAPVVTLAGAVSAQTVYYGTEEPQGLAADGAGNVYVAYLFDDKIRKITKTGNVSILPGAASTRDSGTWPQTPYGLAVDAKGNVYLANSLFGAIKKITPAGKVSILAGSGASGTSNVSGAAASFNHPTGVAVDRTGNVYVADSGSNSIAKITPAGVVSTLAGSGSPGAIDGLGAAASFNYPEAVAVDGNGNVYVADSKNHKVRKITPGGTVSTVAGADSYGFADGVGRSASFSYPTGIAVDRNGNVYVADSGNRKIRKITPDGTVSTLLNLPDSHDITTDQWFLYPNRIAVDGEDNVYFSDSGTVGKIPSAANIPGATSASYTLDAVQIGNAGRYECVVTDAYSRVASRVATVTVDKEPPASGPLPDVTVRATSANGAVVWYRSVTTKNTVGGQTITYSKASGSLFGVGVTTVTATDSVKNKLIGTFTVTVLPPTLEPETSAQSITIPSGYPVTLKVNTTGSGPITYQWRKAASFSTVGEIDGTLPYLLYSGDNPIALDGSGNVYYKTLSDGHPVIQKLTSTGETSTLAGLRPIESATSGIGRWYGDDGGLAADASGNIYFADTNSHSIRKITNTGVVSTLAGSGSAGATDGLGAAASFRYPQSVAVDGTGTVYVADTDNHSIRKITSTGMVSTLAGSGSAGSTDGLGTAASFRYPQSVAVDDTGTVYVADSGNHKIRKITTSGEVTTLAGSGSPGAIDGFGAAASFNSPHGIAVDKTGSVYISEEHTYRDIGIATRVRKITAGFVSTLAGGENSRLARERFFWSSDRFSHSVAGLPTPKQSNAIAVDRNGTVYVGNYSFIQKITPARNIPRATSATYTINAATPEDEGSYECVVTSGAISETSRAIKLTVDKSSIEGPFSPLVLNTDASGQVALPDYAAQAVTSDNVVGGVTQIPAAGTLVTAGIVKVILSAQNEGGIKTSIPVNVEVREFPRIVTQPKALHALNKASVSFTVEAQGYGELRYQWKKDGVPLPDATERTLDLRKVTSEAQGIYTVVVSNGLGSVESTAGQLSFVDLTLADGLYQGLLAHEEATPAPSTHPGRVTVALTRTGSFSGKLEYLGMTYRLSGILSSNLMYQNRITRAGQSSLDVSMELDAEAQTLSAKVTGTDNSLQSAVSMVAQPAYSARNRAPQSGRYTAVFNPTNTAGDVPKTSGYVAIEVSPLGLVGMLGRMPDGAVLTGTAILQHDGSAAYYEPLYSPTPRGAGSLAGSLSFAPDAGTQAVIGQLDWHKPQQKGADLWSSEFDQRLEVEGSAYKIVKGKTIVWDNTEKLQFTADSLNGTNVEMKLENGTDFIVAQPGRSKVTLTLQKATGLMSGSIVDTRTRARRALTGVLLQTQKEARGFYLWKNDTGEWSLSPTGN